MRERRGSSTSSHRVPLELKTGKMHRKQGTIEHRAQVSYTRQYWHSYRGKCAVIDMQHVFAADTILCDGWWSLWNSAPWRAALLPQGWSHAGTAGTSSREKRCGFIWFSAVCCIRWCWFLLAGLLIARNHLARYHSNQGHVTLPSMLRDSHTCKYCSHLKQCTLYHKWDNHYLLLP